MPKIQETVAPTSVTEATITIEEAIQEAIAQARSTCESQGNTSSGCAVAWDIVEELQAERSHRKQGVAKPKTSLEKYCAHNPDAVECLIYDV